MTATVSAEAHTGLPAGPAGPAKGSKPPERPGHRDIITPEGVRVPVELADRGARAAAVSLDIILMFVIIGIAALIITLALPVTVRENAGLPIFLLVWFAVRNFYFIFFELRWRGTTPGKRALGLRVIDRRGGQLRADAVFARNLIREVEIFIPLALLLSPGAVGDSGFATLLILVWAGIFTLMPLFNRDRLRAGDMIGGTWVIYAPKSVLLPDMAAAAATNGSASATTSGTTDPPSENLRPWHRAARARRPDYQFTEAQLSAYGIYELQVLENVLRREGLGAREAIEEVSARIRRKIEWLDGEPVETRPFLEAFYAALRAHLESRMLMGKRRENKHDTP